ncbi:MAG: hypothetical protein MUF81_18025 [Verrucomicrobia bacterium]|jgi:hypothetical protein|nr:hypothetical protein [Verrucomicrobiota bacterium]
MKHLIASILVSFTLPLCLGAADSKPNILVILADDLGETNSLAAAMPEKVGEMKALLGKLITAGRRTPGMQQKNDLEVVRYPRAAVPKKKANPAK